MTTSTTSSKGTTRNKTTLANACDKYFAFYNKNASLKKMTQAQANNWYDTRSTLVAEIMAHDSSIHFPMSDGVEGQKNPDQFLRWTCTVATSEQRKRDVAYMKERTKGM